MKKAVIAVVAMFAAAAFTSSAFAYDHLITNDTSAITAPGGMNAGVGIVSLVASDGWDADGESGELADDMTGLYIPLKFRMGIMDNLEVFGVLPYEKWDMGDFGESGIGDLFVGAKYGVMPEGLLTVRGALILPLGDDENGLGEAGGFGIDVGAMTAYQAGAIGLNGQAGIRWAAEDSDSKIQPGMGIYLDGEACYALSEKFGLQAGLEIMMAGDSKWDGNDVDDSASNVMELGVGGTYKLNETMGLRGDLLFDVAGKNANSNVGVMLGLCYTIK